MAEPANDNHTASAEAFRDAMAHAATAVSIVTTLIDDQPHGTTVSAFMSLSMGPPMLVVSLDNTSRLLSELRIGARVGINVLSDAQAAMATHFARKRQDKFQGIRWERLDGAPSLPGWHAWIAITLTEFVTAGDHTLILGTVNTARSAESTPLIYWRRTYDAFRRTDDAADISGNREQAW